MSKRTNMICRIMDAMPDDAEVQEWCSRELDRAGKSAAKTQERYDMASCTIRMYDTNPVCAKEFADEINTTYDPDDRWTTHTASYYLRQLVSKGEAEEVPNEDKKSGPKMYKYAASTIKRLRL